MAAVAQQAPVPKAAPPQARSDGAAEASGSEPTAEVQPKTSIERMRASVARQQAALDRAMKGAEAVWTRLDTGENSALVRQLESVRRQASASFVALPTQFFTVNWPTTPTGAATNLPWRAAAVYPPMLPCVPMAPAKLEPMVTESARVNNLSANLLKAVIDQESGRYPCAVSPAGALGLMQLMPATAAHFEVDDPFDPQKNVSAGSKYLRMLLDRYGGDLRLALGAYNAGPARVDSAGEVPNITETQNYVEGILKKINPPAQ
jgi:soluble lytic murein transglycosylase-like protein